MQTTILHENCRTDLALELREQMQDSLIDGIKVYTKQFEIDGLEETRIHIVNEYGASMMGKPEGMYVTLEMTENAFRDGKKQIEEAIVDILKDLIASEVKQILVVGLGNRDVTPDALGPVVVEHLQVTRHLDRCGIEKQAVLLSAIAPGVMAQTGMETVEIIKGIVKETTPDVVIVIDALAARQSKRLNRTIQFCDTGIAPGAGVGNNRAKMDKESLGVDVIAIGVPTVIAVPTIICDAMQHFLCLLEAEERKNAVEREVAGKKRAEREAAGKRKADDMNNCGMNCEGKTDGYEKQEDCEKFSSLSSQVAKLSQQEQYQLAQELVQPYFTDLFVTPKNIDEEMYRMSLCIAQGINAYIEGVE